MSVEAPAVTATSVIARYTLLEALRNRLLWLVGIVVGAGLCGAAFLNSVTLTESTQVQAALLAAMLRFGAVFIVVSFVVTSMVRETNDKGLELLLALPIPRSSYFFGKLLGFAAAAVALATILSLPLVLFAAWPDVACWAISLICELLLIVALCLFCVGSLTQVTSALAAVAGFYVLSRSIEAIQVIAASPLDATGRLSETAVKWGVDAISMLLPHLEHFARTEWLLYSAPRFEALAANVIEAAIYGALLCGAALFDLYRKNF